MKKLSTLLLLTLITTLIINAQIPGGGFESWQTITFEYPQYADRTVYHERSAPEDVGYPEKSTDAYNGNFALKMTTTNAEWDDDDDEIDMDNELTLWGKRDWVEVSPDNHEPRITGGLPIHARKDTFVFYYKYVPPAGVIDTAEVSLCFDKDTLEVDNYWNILLATDTYTKFEIPYDLDNAGGGSVEADSMVLALASSKWRNNWLEADTAVEGSSLFIDYMYFKSQLYAITATSGSNGVVSPADTSIIQGDSLLFTITPDAGYEIDSVSYNGNAIFDDLVEPGDDYTYTVNSITEDGTLYVSFKVATGSEELILTKDKILIYPNPVTDVLYITGTTKESMVEFINITGAVVYKKYISGNSSIDVSHIPAGLYFVKVNNRVQCKLFKH